MSTKTTILSLLIELMQDKEALLQRKFALQRQVLNHWHELQRVQKEHELLLSQLRAVRAALEPSPVDELFRELYPEAV